jgi:DNA-binding CsgD family transcriptional regulator
MDLVMMKLEDTPEALLLRLRQALGLANGHPVSEPKLLGEVGSLYAYADASYPFEKVRLVVLSPFLAFNQAMVGAHFGLTPAQTRAAALIACRRSNAEIARALGISPNTARRHTEAVMFRMRVASRADVEQRICAFLQSLDNRQGTVRHR